MQIPKLGLTTLPAVAAVVLSLALATPVAAQDNTAATNLTTVAPSEQQLLEELDTIRGRVTIPNDQAAMLQQPQGRDFQAYHEGWLPWIAGIVILGMLAALVVFYLYRGRIGRSAREAGVRILRFNALERFGHWLTATAFIVLAITGLNFFFGKRLLMPLLGPDAFASWSQVAMFAHDFFSWAFIFGALLLIVLWLWDNLPDRYDLNWLRHGGGMFDKSETTHVPAGRFNAGQKLIFWSVALGGTVLAVTGIVMLLPFSFTDVNGMQLAQTIHGIVGSLLIAVMIAHIYIGTIGMKGAFDAMNSGTVDLNWARQHHSAWVEKKEGTGAPPKRVATPAE